MPSYSERRNHHEAEWGPATRYIKASHEGIKATVDLLEMLADWVVVCHARYLALVSHSAVA